MHVRNKFFTLLLLTSAIASLNAKNELTCELRNVSSFADGKLMTEGAQALQDSIQFSKACCTESGGAYAGSQFLAVLSQNGPLRNLLGKVTAVCEHEAPKTFEVIRRHAKAFGMKKPQLLVSRIKFWFNPAVLSAFHSFGFIILDGEELRFLTDDQLEGRIIHNLNKIRHSHGLRYLLLAVPCYFASRYAVERVANGVVGKLLDGSLDAHKGLPTVTTDSGKESGEKSMETLSKLATSIKSGEDFIANTNKHVTTKTTIYDCEKTRVLGKMFGHKQVVQLLENDWLKRLVAGATATLPLAFLSRYLEQEADLDGCYTNESAQKILKMAEFDRYFQEFTANEWNLLKQRIGETNNLPIPNKIALYTLAYTMGAYRELLAPIRRLLSHKQCASERVKYIEDRIQRLRHSL